MRLEEVGRTEKREDGDPEGGESDNLPVERWGGEESKSKVKNNDAEGRKVSRTNVSSL